MVGDIDWHSILLLTEVGGDGYVMYRACLKKIGPVEGGLFSEEGGHSSTHYGRDTTINTITSSHLSAIHLYYTASYPTPKASKKRIDF